MSRAKRDRLAALSTPRGVIAALAIDQRKSLRRMLAEAAGTTLENIPDSRLGEFKTLVTRTLTPNTTAVLLDPEYGLSAALERSANCGLLLAYEMDGYENPRSHRMLALMPRCSVRRLRDAGAQGIKILLHFAPDDSESANDEKRALIERIGNECHALDMPFFLEPVVYDPAGDDPRSFEFAKRKPGLVIRTMQEFSRDIYGVDILKVEFPVIASYVDGATTFAGRAAYTYHEAIDHFRRADEAARLPYIYLSAGVSSAEFVASLQLAVQAGAHFSGVLCGRANWQGGVPEYVKSANTFDGCALQTWLENTGAANVRQINGILESAVGWHEWHRNAT